MGWVLMNITPSILAQKLTGHMMPLKVNDITCNTIKVNVSGIITYAINQLLTLPKINSP